MAHSRLRSNLISLLSYIPAISATVALILGCIQNFSCRTVTFPQNGDSGYGNLDAGPFLFRLRMFYTNSVQGDWLVDVCRSYKELTNEFGFEYDDDEATNAVRAFAVIAAFLGGISTLLICFVPLCGATSVRIWKPYGILLILTGIAQGMTLMVTRSSICTNNPVLQVLEDIGWSIRDTVGTVCESSVGYSCGVASTAIWVTAGISIFCLPAPKILDEDWVTSFGYWGMPKNKNPKEDEMRNSDD